MKKTLFILFLLFCTTMNLFSSEEIDCTYKIKSILYHSSIGDNGEVVEHDVVCSGLGVGITIAGENLILTVLHIVNTGQNNLKQILVEVENNYVKCTVVKMDIENDLCLLRPSSIIKNTAKISDTNLTEEDPVTAVKYFPEFVFKISKGKVRVVEVRGLTESMLIDIFSVDYFSFGMSGGAVFNEKKEIVGIIKAGISFDNANNFPLSISASLCAITNFLGINCANTHN